MLKYSSPLQKEVLFYWQRETASSNAEVDFIIQKHEGIIPIEGKSAAKGSMNSLFQFLKEKNRPYGIRIALEIFLIVHDINIITLYTVSNIVQITVI